MVTFLHTDKAPRAAGPYSQATEHSGTIYVSGQLGIVPETGKMIDNSDVERQTEQALANMLAILQEAGVGKKNVLKCNLYLMDMANFQRVNAVYEKFFEGHKPARACVQVAALPLGGLFEIECIAHK